MKKKLLTSLLLILKNNLERLNIDIIYCKLNNVIDNIRYKINKLTRFVKKLAIRKIN